MVTPRCGPRYVFSDTKDWNQASAQDECGIWPKPLTEGLGMGALKGGGCDSTLRIA